MKYSPSTSNPPSFFNNFTSVFPSTHLTLAFRRFLGPGVRSASLFLSLNPQRFFQLCTILWVFPCGCLALFFRLLAVFCGSAVLATPPPSNPRRFFFLSSRDGSDFLTFPFLCDVCQSHRYRMPLPLRFFSFFPITLLLPSVSFLLVSTSLFNFFFANPRMFHVHTFPKDHIPLFPPFDWWTPPLLL